MSTVEIETGTYIKRYAFWNPATWGIPKLYWDAISQEQRLHAICRQLGKVIAYADYLGVNTDDIAARLKAIEDGQLTPMIEAVVEQWFEDNKPEIIHAIEQLQTDIDDTNLRIDGLERDTNAAIQGLKDKFTVYSWYYGLDNTGETDITDQLQAAIDELPAKTTFIFDKGTYKFGQIHINKEFFIDFNESELILTDEYGIVFSVTEKSTFPLPAKIAANDPKVTIPSNVTDEDILIVKNDTQRTTYDRGTYYAGLAAEVYEDYYNNICISPVSPVDILSSGSECHVYAKTRFGVKNVSEITFTSDTLYKNAIVANNGFDCVFENINCNGSIRSVVGLVECVNSTIRNVNCDAKAQADNIAYPVNITNSSNTTVENCHIKSEWHAVSTQGYYFCLNTQVNDCVLVSGRAEAYLDHSNGLNSCISNSTLVGGVLVSCGSVIENCKIYDNGSTTGHFYAHVFIKPTQLDGLAGITLSDVTFYQKNADNIVSCAPIKLFYSASEGGSSEIAARIPWIYFDNCNLLTPAGNTPIIITSRDNTMPEVLIPAIRANNTAIGIISQSNTDITYSEVDICNATLDQSTFSNFLFYFPQALDNKLVRIKIENCHLVTRTRPFIEALMATVMINNMTINANTTDNVAVNSNHVMYCSNCSKSGAATVLQTGTNTHFVNTYLN